jgi:hypothetical protein
MTTPKKKVSTNSDVEFQDVFCMSCNKKVPFEETKEMMTREELNQIESA